LLGAGVQPERALDHIRWCGLSPNRVVIEPTEGDPIVDYDRLRGIVGLFDAADLQRGGYRCEDRQRNRVMHPVVTLSLGIVRAEPGHFRSHLEIAAAASEAKKQAKRMPGNSLFVNRRMGPSAGLEAG
jgi:hypothetical protein